MQTEQILIEINNKLAYLLKGGMTKYDSRYTLSLKECADYTGLSEDKLRDAIACGELEAYRPEAIKDFKPDAKPKLKESDEVREDKKTGKKIFVKRKKLEEYIERYQIIVPQR